MPDRIDEVKRAWPATREVAAHPRLRIEWLKTARRAQVIAAIAIVVGLFVMPPVRDAVADFVAPPKEVGFFHRHKTLTSGGRALRTLIDALYWIGALGLTGGALVLHAPVVLGRRRELGTGGDVATDATMLPGSSAMAATTAPSPPGASDASRPGGRYELRGELGRGAMGVVHLAYDPVLDRTVALKELPPALRTGDFAARFRTEARALAKLTHPGIVQVFDLVEDGGGLWMAMELVTGGSLDQRLEAGPLPVEEVVRLGAKMAEAMAHAHDAGIIHRDFKPHNVLMTEGGEPKLSDFGLAKMMQAPSMTQAGAVLGSPAYMSPEQASGQEADARSDAYAFGATLYHMLTGQPPFDGETASVLVKHITQPPPKPSELVALPPELESLVLELLAKEPAGRPVDLHAVATRLLAMGTAQPATAGV